MSNLNKNRIIETLEDQDYKAIEVVETLIVKRQTARSIIAVSSAKAGVMLSPEEVIII